MQQENLDYTPLPLVPRVAIGLLGLCVAALGVVHGMAAFARYHARAQR